MSGTAPALVIERLIGILLEGSQAATTVRQRAIRLLTEEGWLDTRGRFIDPFADPFSVAAASAPRIHTAAIGTEAPRTGARVELVTVEPSGSSRDGGPMTRRHHLGRVFAANGEQTWRTSETYQSPSTVLRAFESLLDTLDAVRDPQMAGVYVLTPVTQEKP